MSKMKINIPLNRVEGDLEISVDIDNGIVSDAWSSGTLYRGFEKILLGRGAMDGLVITPRICGICSTSHLTAAAKALDAVVKVNPPPDAIRIRNIVQMTEHIQSDIRHAFLMFAVDFVNQAYKKSPLFEEAVRRYEPFKGETVIQTIKETKKLIEIIAIIGGQWPHSSYMVPGGIVSVPSASDLLQCRLLLNQYRNWYEKRIIGCSLERFKEIISVADLNAWLEECNSHWESDLGFYIRFTRAMGLDKIGRGHDFLLSYGSLDLPSDTKIKGSKDQNFLIPSGFINNKSIDEFNSSKITEHVAYSWYMDHEGGKHPFDGETKPYATGNESRKYSWSKAPRYDGFAAETGPLAEMVISGNKLIDDLITCKGISVFVRELARIIRSIELIPIIETWISEVSCNGNFYKSPGEIIEGEGYGLTHASRGALGHWVKIKDGKILHYQIITPTAWNASPRDSDGIRGPIEEALVGTPVQDISNPIEVGHIVRSFDVCLVCTVH
ncbi:MAG: nickel-dependent hydrogenase large subunit [Desulfobacterales bacterium]|nr:nickel-dependent hydrogenase large subunit [Desulfobacterales bacterium]